MTTAALIYPHQVYVGNPALTGTATAVLVEEPLFFCQYAFHRKKLILHRATMQRLRDELVRRGMNVHYFDAATLRDTEAIAPALSQKGIRSVRYVDPCDDWLGRRLAVALESHRITAEVLPDPHFLTPVDVVSAFSFGRDHFRFSEFYAEQRKRLRLLVDGAGRPAGGKWSFDAENRKKLPRGISVPDVPIPGEEDDVRRARDYVRKHFPQAMGSDAAFHYPIDAASAAAGLEAFVEQRLARFGDYEDAISVRHATLFHSVLTPALNIGIVSPRQIVDAVMAKKHEVPLNSLEGFVRQVIGWREFVRVVYLARGRQQRSRNHWGSSHSMPRAFYDATTGIDPVDTVIRRVLEHGYCHHIERLMILGNFMLLCDIEPDAVYRWFMELFVDAYDWVMVPNVYGMSQHADGGGMTTKPYISGSSYVLKMSDFKRGPWCSVWDALYWRFIDNHAEKLRSNPRMALIVKARDGLGGKLDEHRRRADAFLSTLHA